jgi:hypothetical protein
MNQQKSRENQVKLDFISREFQPFLFNIGEKQIVLQQKAIQKEDDLGNTVWDGYIYLF